ncbi:MAG: hypothetical protein AMXMBFR64_14100 [Myxococcales bacterium]
MDRLLAENRARMARNRLSRQPVAARLTVGAVGLGAAAGLLLAGGGLADAVLEASDQAGAARELGFWLAVALAMITSYTVLEALFRTDEARVLAPLPVEPRAWARYTAVRVALLHLPLLAVALLVVAPLSLRAAPLGLAAAAVVALTSAVAVPFALLAHLLAGAAMLSGDSDVKRRLAGGLGPSEAAWFFYSPALALAATLVATVVLDLAARASLQVGNPKPLLLAGAVALVAAAAAIRSALVSFAASYASILPRFWQAEIVPPWREEHLPSHVRGLWAARLLEGSAREVFTKDVVQLSRRHRVDGVALVLFASACALLHARGAGWEWGALLVAVGGALFNPAFRLLGPELEPPSAGRSLPVAAGEIARARLLAVAVLQAPALGLAAAAGLLGPDGLGGAALAALVGAPVALALGALSVRWGLAAFPAVRPVAWTVRLGALGAAATAIALLPPL